MHPLVPYLAAMTLASDFLDRTLITERTFVRLSTTQTQSQFYCSAETRIHSHPHDGVLSNRSTVPTGARKILRRKATRPGTDSQPGRGF